MTQPTIMGKCPYCRANTGVPCRDLTTNQRMDDFHAERMPADAARNNPDAFGRWIIRGIGLAIGFVIVGIPLAIIGACAQWVANSGY